jgi:hypothetical protein
LAQPWAEIGRIYRRICVLRLNGRAAEAGRLHDGEFSAAVEAWRAKNADDPDFSAQLEAQLDAEEERAAEAVALAELLLPLLSDQLGRAPAAAVRPAAAPARPAGPRATPGIADFIDEMLAHDRAERPGAS